MIADVLATAHNQIDLRMDRMLLRILIWRIRNYS